MTDFDQISRADLTVILDIVRRATTLAWDERIPLNRLTLEMDLIAAHLHEPLALNPLLRAQNSDFMHDINGIVRHLDRRTGQFTGGFMPRYAALYHTRTEIPGHGRERQL